MKNSNHFFLISFLPAIAYWYLEENYSLQIALIGGMGLAIIEIALEKIFFKHIHSISKLNFFLILFLGVISLIGDEGIWFKLQPFFTGLFMGLLLIWKTSRGGSYFYEMIQTMNKALPPRPLIMMMEKHSGFFLLLYGCFMALIAFRGTTEQWLFLKTIGFYIAFVLFMIFELFYLRQKRY